MRQVSLLSSVCTLFFWLIAPGQALSDDKPSSEEPKVIRPTIHFRDLPKTPPMPGVPYRIDIKIEVDGAEEKIETFITTQVKPPGGSMAPAGPLALTLGTVIKNSPGWKGSYSQDKGTVVVEGWTDPKTQKFYPVKSIKFESKNVPKECMPVVKMPPNL